MSSYYPSTGHDPTSPSMSTNAHAGLHQSSFHNLTLEHSLEDLSARFIVNLPAEELESMDRVCFQIEQAHWYYEDFIRPAALNPGLLPSYGLKAFSLLMFRSCPLLHDLLPNHAKIWNSFMAYKERVPVCGAIIISEYWDKVLLVKGWTKGSSWSFPRGKINKEEPEAMCAVREVLEETGFDATDYFHPLQFEPGYVEDEGAERIPYYVELVIKEQKIRLYFLPGVKESTVFETRTRKEISKIEWFKLNDLPTWSKDKKGRTTRTKAQLEGKQAKFYMVTPFISHLKLWIDHHRPKNLPPRPPTAVAPRGKKSISPHQSPRMNGHDHLLHDDATYHLPSEVELGDSTSAEADSTEDELDDVQHATAPVAFETTQEGTDALTALFFGSPPASTNAMPLSPLARSQSFEMASSTPPHVVYERQSSFVQPKPQASQQSKLLDLLSGAVPSPPPPRAPTVPHPQYPQSSMPPQSAESRSLLHLLQDVNLNSPTTASTPQESTPQYSSTPAAYHQSPSASSHSILFSDSQAPPEAEGFGQPLPAHLHPDRNDSERKEKHNALLRALFSVAAGPTPPIVPEENVSTPTASAWSPSTLTGTGARSRDNGSELGKNGTPYGPDEDEEIWPPPVMRRNQLFPLEATPAFALPPVPPQSLHADIQQQQRYEAPLSQQFQPAPVPSTRGNLLSLLNGPGGERALRAPAPQDLPSHSNNLAASQQSKDPLELLREHRARQQQQQQNGSTLETVTASTLPPPAPPIPIETAHTSPAQPLHVLPVSPNRTLPNPLAASSAPSSLPFVSGTQAYPTTSLAPVPQMQAQSGYYPTLQPHQQMPPYGHAATGVSQLPLQPGSFYQQPFPVSAAPASMPHQPSAFPNYPPVHSFASPPNATSEPLPRIHPLGPPPTTTANTFPPPRVQPPLHRSMGPSQPPQPVPQPNPIELDSREQFPPLGAAPSLKGGKSGSANSGALLGLLNGR